jgi:hypothetical protein
MKKTTLLRKTPLRAKTGFKRASTIAQVEKKTQKRVQSTPLSKLSGKRQNLAKSTKKKSLPSLAKLKKKLDSIFSQYIRRKYADKEGMVKCYTCTTRKHWKEMQNGHFISRQYLVTRFDENNCRPQDSSCNIFAHGKPLDFEENLKRELGEGFVEVMKASRHKTVKLDRAWYELMIMTYSDKLASL